jgi:phosphatidylglycerophosphate synthase
MKFISHGGLYMANFITTFRVFVAIIALAMININPMCNFISLFLILACMLLDAADGYIARYFNASSLSGSIYDILADRIVENIFFIYFASQSLFSVWIAVAVVIRSLVVDAIRTIFLSVGKTAFGETTLHSKKWSKFFACSQLSRGSYNTFKMLTFLSYAALLAPNGYLFYYLSNKYLLVFASICLWITLFLSFIRALPVVYEGWFYDRLLKF